MYSVEPRRTFETFLWNEGWNVEVCEITPYINAYSTIKGILHCALKIIKKNF